MFYSYCILFFIYSFLGWIMEVTLTLITDKKFVNRGFLLGPCCPIYGCGCILLNLLLHNYTNNILVLFILTMFTCSLLEYITSFLMEKIFKTINEQVEILKDKGLIIEDELEAKEILLRENYFFIMGYRHLFMSRNNKSKFISGTTFNEVYALFEFDRNFRNIIFKNALVIENQLKSVISYQLSKKYGYREKDYLNPKNFTQDHDKIKRVHDLINKMKRQIRINASSHNATIHYMNNYGYIPLWVLVKVLSFGIVCELFTILKKEDQIEVADIFGTTPEVLQDILIILSNYRNLCAHEDIVFEHRTERVIPDTKYHEEMNIPKMDGEYIYGKNDLFAVIIIFKILLNEKNFRLMMKEIEYEIELLDGRVDTIPISKVLDRMGFPENYIEIIDK